MKYRLMPDINPLRYSLKAASKITRRSASRGIHDHLQDDDLDTEELLDHVLAFADDHGWKHGQLVDHCFVAHILLLNQLILKGYPEYIPVPPVLMRLIRVISILDLSSASRA